MSALVVRVIIVLVDKLEVVGGFNGGGNSGYNTNGFGYNGGGGGGATHFATYEGTLEELGKDNLSKILMVAGGGGRCTVIGKQCLLRA